MEFTELESLIQRGSAASPRGVHFADIESKLENRTSDRALRDDFQHLKNLGLVIVQGRGRGAQWKLAPHLEE